MEIIDGVPYINNLSFSFSNIDYPEGVVGHTILQAVPDEVDRTVLDAGYLFPVKERSSNDIKTWKETIFDDDLRDDVYKFIGHHSYIEGIKQGDYMKLEYEVGVTDKDFSNVK